MMWLFSDNNNIDARARWNLPKKSWPTLIFLVLATLLLSIPLLLFCHLQLQELTKKLDRKIWWNFQEFAKRGMLNAITFIFHSPASIPLDQIPSFSSSSYLAFIKFLSFWKGFINILKKKIRWMELISHLIFKLYNSRNGEQKHQTKVEGPDANTQLELN